MSSEDFLADKWIKKLDRQTRDLIDRVGVDKKTLDQVFDKPTLLNIGKLISDKVIDYIDFPISTGKEAIVFRGVSPTKKFVAIKIYRTSITTFKKISKYLEGDPRFCYIKKNRREIIYEWAIKEFKNLERLKQSNIRAPIPIKRIKNIVVMEYIGNAKQAAPQLIDVELQNPTIVFDEILKFLSMMYQDAALVHADFSAYNILMYKNKPFIIDLGQGVLLEHPLALDFLKRDIHNIVQFFNKFKITTDEEKILNTIIKNSE
jgi:RIO kinase 1